MLPTFHIGGLGLYAGPTFHAGGTVVVMRAFDPGELLRLIQDWQVTVLLLVPSIYLVLAQFPDFDQVRSVQRAQLGQRRIGAAAFAGAAIRRRRASSSSRALA